MVRRLLYLAVAVALFLAGYLAGTASHSFSEASSALQGNQQGNCQTFPETGKTVCGRFLAYWQQHGGLPQQGYPISGEFQERSDLNGQTYTVQYFERAVFEYHPENQPPYDVLLSQLGTFRFREKYGAGSPAPTQTAATAPTATVPQPPIAANIGDPVERNGIRFTVTRVDNSNNKRIDVLFKIENRSPAPVSFVLKNSDQTLRDATGTNYAQTAPDNVTPLALAAGQLYSGGTSFNVDLTGRIIKGLKYTINNLPGLGTVIVDIPLQ